MTEAGGLRKSFSGASPEWHATSGQQVVYGGVRKGLPIVQGGKCSEDVTSPGRLTHLMPGRSSGTPA